jgi:hypothetical protein
VACQYQKEKKIRREKQQKAAAKAADLGLEGPPKKIPKVHRPSLHLLTTALPQTHSALERTNGMS